jgi:hypothetical protein
MGIDLLLLIMLLLPCLDSIGRVVQSRTGVVLPFGPTALKVTGVFQRPREELKTPRLKRR